MWDFLYINECSYIDLSACGEKLLVRCARLPVCSPSPCRCLSSCRTSTTSTTARPTKRRCSRKTSTTSPAVRTCLVLWASLTWVSQVSSSYTFHVPTTIITTLVNVISAFMLLIIVLMNGNVSSHFFTSIVPWNFNLPHEFCSKLLTFEFWSHVLSFNFYLFLLCSFSVISGGKDDEKDEVRSDQWLYDSVVLFLFIADKI